MMDRVVNEAYRKLLTEHVKAVIGLLEGLYGGDYISYDHPDSVYFIAKRSHLFVCELEDLLLDVPGVEQADEEAGAVTLEITGNQEDLEEVVRQLGEEVMGEGSNIL